MPPAERNLLSIGALSRAVGVPIETIRTWERRYGVPSAQRTPSGHRRYPLLAVQQLRLVVQALEHGQPPSVALRMDVPALQRMLGATAAAGAPEPAAREPGSIERSDVLERWFEHIERFEGRALERELRAAWAAAGGLAFIERFAAPFLVELGARWQREQLRIAHEHFASERLREFLVQQWRPLSDAATGGCFVCATPDGEPHVLGLQLAALTLAIHNARVVFLGASLPVQEIAEAVRHHAAEAVVLSASAWLPAAALAREVGALRQALPHAVPVLAGGCATWPEAAAGLIVLRRFTQLGRWVLDRERGG